MLYKRKALTAAVLLAAAALAVLLYRHLYDPTATFVGGKLQPPSRNFLLGTDQLGRDVWSRLAAATGITLGCSFLSVLIASFVGSLLGMLAGYRALPLVSPLLLFVGQLSLVFPMRWLPLILVALFGNGMTGMVLSMVVSIWGQFFWIVHDETKGLRGREFMKAAGMLGATRWGAIRMHVVPHLLPTVLILAVVTFRMAIGIISTLSFLGIGIQPPTPTWGSMIAEGHPYLLQAWWMVLFPTAALACSIVAASAVGRRLERKWKPEDHKEGTAHAVQ
jgi:peptide/nickel transport system permease protein